MVRLMQRECVVVFDDRSVSLGLGDAAYTVGLLGCWIYGRVRWYGRGDEMERGVE